MLSIIIPCYNVESYLLTCVQSILQQSYQKIEIILIDDGSTDRTRMLMETHCLDPRIHKIYLDTNYPVGKVRNIGLQHAHGAYITFVDADDYVHPDIYQCTLPLLEDPEVDAVYFDHYVVSPSFQRVSEVIANGTSGLYEKQQKALFFRKASYCWNVIFKADLLKTGWKLYELALYEDLACHMLLVHANKVGYVKQPLYYHRKHSASVTECMVSEKHYSIIDAVGMLIQDITGSAYKAWFYDSSVNIAKVFSFYYVYHMVAAGKCQVHKEAFYRIRSQFQAFYDGRITLFADPLIWLHLHHTNFLLFLLKIPFLRNWIGKIARRHMG